ncbi:MAG: GNAT family N-acetyltransferase [Defluviitaleaceae bacterium]|nr:GNAT family N-acetyltransferase [Defluviitaleaceae bacterium]MCL2239094.1 GNAT family N-acetyltransferase [Defluviitaleaceae bacterium]
MNFIIHPIDPTLRERIQPILDATWRGPFLAINGKLWDSRVMPGYAALREGEILGYILYVFHPDACEIMVLHSLAENGGVATALIEEAKGQVKAEGVAKIIVQTSNDNTRAFRFYQRRGFVLREIRLGAIARSRAVKPVIPLTGRDGIPLRDEIEFEIHL